MSDHSKVTEWTCILHTHLPDLSEPQGTVLALWSLGMVLARSCIQEVLVPHNQTIWQTWYALAQRTIEREIDTKGNIIREEPLDADSRIEGELKFEEEAIVSEEVQDDEVVAINPDRQSAILV